MKTLNIVVALVFSIGVGVSAQAAGSVTSIDQSTMPAPTPYRGGGSRCQLTNESVSLSTGISATLDGGAVSVMLSGERGRNTEDLIRDSQTREFGQAVQNNS